MNKTVVFQGLRHQCKVRSPPMLEPYAVTLCLAWQDMELVKPEFDDALVANCFACIMRAQLEEEHRGYTETRQNA